MIGALFTPVIAIDAVEDALSGIAEALRVPVSIAVIVLLGLLAFEFGRLLIEAARRLRPKAPRLESVATEALTHPDEDAKKLGKQTPSGLAEQAVLGLQGAVKSGERDGIENALADYELAVQRRLDRTRMMVRAGPALGLMGTLIPLAPGLSALGDGDFSTLAADLQVAFAATVLGILVGTGAFALTLVRTRLYTEDLAGLERAVAAYDPKGPAHKRVTAAVGEHDA